MIFGEFMAKLYFRYGTIGSAKTLNLLAVAHNYRQQGKKIILMKPDMDTRFGKEKIRSRAGLEEEADVLIHPECRCFHWIFRGLAVFWSMRRNFCLLKRSMSFARSSSNGMFL